MGILSKYLFDDYKIVKDTARIVTQVITNASRKHDETLKDISEAEIKSKDRVDISLEEYELLKKENQALRERCMHAEYILKQMYIDPKVVEKIDPSSVSIWEMRDDPDPFNKHIRIEFDVSVVGLRSI